MPNLAGKGEGKASLTLHISRQLRVCNLSCIRIKAATSLTAREGCSDWWSLVLILATAQVQASGSLQGFYQGVLAQQAPASPCCSSVCEYPLSNLESRIGLLAAETLINFEQEFS